MRLSRSPDATVRLLCFPYAGAGASVYYTWSRMLLPEIDVYAIQLPGREDRHAEPLSTNLSFLVDSVIGAICGLSLSPFALFGHSMGALLAFEVARTLRERGLPEPVHLFVSGRQGPQALRTGEPLHLLPESVFLLECVRRYQGIPQAILDEPELVKIFLPILRADMQAVETYTYKTRDPLDVPITALHGKEDHSLKPQDIELWRNETFGEFSHHAVPGGHFFLHTARDQVLEIIRKAVLPRE